MTRRTIESDISTQILHKLLLSVTVYAKTVTITNDLRVKNKYKSLVTVAVYLIST